MRIGICDDERQTREKIKDFVQGFVRNSEIEEYDPEQLLHVLKQMDNEKESDDPQSEQDSEKESDDQGSVCDCDIMIMDIEFPGRNFDGIALTKLLNRTCKECQVIYLTHILEFAPEVYETEHCYFVMKNDMSSMLGRALEKAIQIYDEKHAAKPLEVMSQGHKVFIPMENIRYVEKKQRQTMIYTDKKSYICYESITTLSKRLDHNIVRCHGGYLVNITHVTYLGGEKVITDIPDVVIPIGKTYKDQTKQAYLKYWMKRM